MAEDAEAEAVRRWDGWLGPRIWGPAGGFLLAVIGVLAGLLVSGALDGSSAARECKPGQPGCELRQKVHWHADFAVFIRGQKVDFGKPEYISVEGKDLSEDVHIHNPRHNVVHVHREQTTWDEFFRSLGWELTDNCLKARDGTKYCNGNGETLKLFKNGVRVDSLMFADISDLDRVLIAFGKDSDDDLLKKFDLSGLPNDANGSRGNVTHVTDQACIPSEACSSRMPPPGAEPEPCAKSGTQCN